MKRLFFGLVTSAVLLAAGAAGYRCYSAPASTSSNVYRTVSVRRGDVVPVVTSTGTVQPVLSVQIGSFVSGIVSKVNVDYNTKVKAGQVLAVVDPRLYRANLAHEEAALAHAKADLARINALLEQAIRTEKRGIQLKPRNAISETDLDQCTAERKSLEAQRQQAEASILECQANLDTAKTNLEYTDIRSPVNGIITDRKVDPGQTVASQFQTPVLFVVAPDLEKTVLIYAAVDEADIGLIRDAQTRNEPVLFSVDAYPRHIFQGKIAQVRLNPTTVHNVVTYTVVVQSTNSQFRLLPGMTAKLSFQIDKKTSVPVVPNAALRFRPKPEQVHEQYRPLLDKIARESRNSRNAASSETSAEGGKTASTDERNRRYVWTIADDQLAPVEIQVGMSDKNAAELLAGDLDDGQELVVGVQSP